MPDRLFYNTAVESLLQKYFASRPTQIRSMFRAVPSHKGRCAMSRTLGRDAVDAGGAVDDGAFSRTAKSCGPDAPTLASSSRKQFRGRRWQTSPVTGESAKETVKTTARGMPDVSGVTVVTNACAFYHGARGCGRAERPAFPAPSDWRVRNFPARLRRNAPRECGAAFFVIACDKREAFAQGSEATKQFILFVAPRNGLLRFARNDDLCCLKIEPVSRRPCERRDP